MSTQAALDRNPFSPTFGRAPLVWVGRQQALESFKQALESDNAHMARSLLIDGARGVGKTVLLGELEDLARTAGWTVFACDNVKTVVANLRDTLIPQEIAKHTRPTQHTSKLTIKTPIADLEHSESPAPDGIVRTLRSQLERLAEVLPRGHGGIFITVDEVQDVNLGDLQELSSTFQVLRRSDIDIAIAFAGLSGGIADLLNSEGATFLRRAKRYTLGPLNAQDSLDLLVDTAAESAIPMDRDAAEQLARMARGYPYLLQLGGQLAWDAARATKRDAIDADTAASVKDEALYILGDNVHHSEYLHLTERQREFVDAMAAVATTTETELSPYPMEGAATSDIAAHLGVPITAISGIRSRLLKRGTVVAGERGMLYFPIPYFVWWLHTDHTPQWLN